MIRPHHTLRTAFGSGPYETDGTGPTGNPSSGHGRGYLGSEIGCGHYIMGGQAGRGIAGSAEPAYGVAVFEVNLLALCWIVERYHG